MTTIHFRDEEGRIVGMTEFDSYQAVSAAVIDESYEERYRVAIGDDGTLHCETCDQCEHSALVREVLDVGD